MKTIYQILSLACIGAAVGGAWALDFPARFHGSQAKTAATLRGQADETRRVIVREVAFASDAAVIEAVGTGKAVKSVVLFPEAEGVVTSVPVEAGQTVKAGQALLVLESEEEKLAVELARVNAADARVTLERYERIASGRAVTINQLEAARKAMSLARIQLAQAELALRRRTLAAPFTGVIGIPKVQPGDRITTTTEVVTLDDRSALLVDFEVPAALAFGVRKAAELKAATWALRGEAFTGTVAELGSRIDERTRTLQVRARIANEQDRLRPGMAFSITLPLAGRQYPSVPAVAIRWERKGAHVWTVREGAAHRVRVEVIKRSEGWVLVDAPLKRGDVVVIEGIQRLRPGAKVAAERAEEPPPSGMQ